jgi:hypothetical protein
VEKREKKGRKKLYLEKPPRAGPLCRGWSDASKAVSKIINGHREISHTPLKECVFYIFVFEK